MSIISNINSRTNILEYLPSSDLTNKKRRWITAYLLLLPSVAILFTFRFLSMLYNVYLSFFETGFTQKEFVGLNNYTRLMSDDVFVTALMNNILFFATIPVGIAIALGLALLLNKRFPGANVMRSAFFIPYITAMVAIAVIWQYMLRTDGGVINFILIQVGLLQEPISWLGDSFWARISVFIVHLWKSIGFFLIILLAGLQNISTQVYEVARIDGASAYQRFRYVTLPLLKPTIGVCMLVGLVTTWRIFDLVTVMTGGGPGFSTEILLTWLYKQAFSYGRIGYAAVLAIVLWVVYIGVTVLVQVTTRSDY